MNYSDITTYAVNTGIDSNYREINSLIRENLRNGTMPFLSDTNLPQDMNVITGKNNLDINSEKISLKAAAIGAASTMWIYGADAEFLGLELKSKNPAEYRDRLKASPGFDCKPVIIQRGRERLTDRDMSGRTNVLNEALCVDCQCAYLMDQFTEKSVERLFTQRKLEERLEMSGIEMRAGLVANEILKHRTEYNTGELSAEHTKYVRQNLYLNLQKKSPVLQEIIDTRNAYFKNYLPEQKTVFDYYYKHFNEQSAGTKLYKFSAEQKDRLSQSLESLLKKIDENPKLSGMIARTIFDAKSFSERLTHQNFSLEPIFTKEEERQAKANGRNSGRPAARRGPQAGVDSIIDERTKERYRSRSFSMHVGEDIGM